MLNGYDIGDISTKIDNATLVIEREDEVIVLNINDIRDILLSQEYGGESEIRIQYFQGFQRAKTYPKSKMAFSVEEAESAEDIDEFLSQFRREDGNADKI